MNDDGYGLPWPRPEPHQRQARLIGCSGSLVAFVALIAWFGAGLGTIDSATPPPTGPLGGSLFLVIFGTSVVGAIGSVIGVYRSTRLIGAALLLVAGLTALLSGGLLLMDGFYFVAGVLAVIAGLALILALVRALQQPGPPSALTR
jgi:hypothetical protein